VAFDQYKTQVLLLHSEQSTLDSLSSGFSDRYTVHCATTGSEALNTLVETPINVIITAQKLPGMSGLEALREAKKRSPDTVGILLAGSGDDGLEALVGDEEVFQIVRGNVTADSLLKLVDTATRQMRLMALAESANDTAAHPDEPAEHIVMETSENGSTIISGHTGRMPALNPEKVSAAASVGSQSVDVLVLTKDQEFLTTIIESSRGMHEVHYANTLAQAEETIRQHKVGVAVVDAAMVGQKVEQLTLHLRKGAPRLVSIVAGRRDDGEMLMELINRGKVYRFLLKPVSPGRARLAVEASVKHHLEAPDAAFKISGSAAPSKPMAKAVPKAKPRPAAKAAPKAKAPTKPAAVKPAAPPPQRSAKPAKPAPAAKAAPGDPPLGDLTMDSPIDEGLSSAFGDDDTSFTETVTGLFSTMSAKLKGDASEPPVSPDETAMNIPTAAPASSAGRSSAKNTKVIGIAAVVVVAVAAAAFWWVTGEDETATLKDPVADNAAPSATEAAGDSAEAGQSSAEITALVEEARLARDAGQVFNPAGSNAIELYAAAVDADPSNVLLEAELDAVIQQALQMAETALLDSRVDDAAAALQRVSIVDPSNSRLPFLSAQLWQMQLRSHLTNARAAIRDERFEDASNALAAAIALNLGDTSEIEEVRAELNRARSAQQVGGVLGKANARLQDGNLLSPPNDNARYYYELLLASDPTNAAARQGLDAVASKVVLQARSEIDAGNLDAAANLLGQARAIDPASNELDATAAALSAARDAIARRIREAEEERLRIQAANRQAAADKAAAEKAAAEQAAAEKVAAEQAAAEKAAAENAAALAAAKPDPGTTTSGSAGTGEVASQPVAQQRTPEPTPVAVRDQAPVSVSSLSRTRYVAPKYPRAAQRRNLSGWVDVVFTVAMDGSVKDINVRSADPEGVFDDAALRAVEKWEFEPVIENGILVEKRAGVRMMFALE